LAFSFGLLGVLGATSACRCPFPRPLPHLFFYFHRHSHSCHWEEGTPSSLYGILLIDMCYGFHDRVCLSPNSLISERTPSEPDARSSMVIFETSPVIPTDTLWFVLLLLIGVLGFMGQVSSSVLSSSPADPDTPRLWRHF
jgi:hypothetical protein